MKWVAMEAPDATLTSFCIEFRDGCDGTSPRPRILKIKHKSKHNNNIEENKGAAFLRLFQVSRLLVYLGAK